MKKAIIHVYGVLVLQLFVCSILLFVHCLYGVMYCTCVRSTVHSVFALNQIHIHTCAYMYVHTCILLLKLDTVTIEIDVILPSSPNLMVPFLIADRICASVYNNNYYCQNVTNRSSDKIA